MLIEIILLLGYLCSEINVKPNFFIIDECIEYCSIFVSRYGNQFIF